MRASKGLLAVGLLAATIAATAPSAGGVLAHGLTIPVIVQGHPNHPAAAADAVETVGGSVTYDLSIIDGVAADIPAASVARLRAMPGVRAVTPDAPVDVQSTSASTSTNLSTINSVFAREVQADLLWAEGVKGAGVTVALIDTGVTEVPDLSGRIVTGLPDPVNEGETDDVCANFSGSVDPAAKDDDCTDEYGHGTFIAGLIAGNGASSGGRFSGVAPEARIVSIKIAGADGSSDVSKLLAALQYVVRFKNLLDIDVLNLSLGTNSRQSYTLDPLNYAVERVWAADVAVVVAAGNLGPLPGSISKPADDPFVITVGAVDDRETPANSDDRVPNFSGRGPTAADGLRKPDVTAPGARLVSLRAPGSRVESAAPSGFPSSVYRRGSGTSMSAAVVSGVVALLRDRNDWEPDEVKYALAATATKVGLLDPLAAGAGMVQAHRAAHLAEPGKANAGVDRGTGLGSLEESRGDVATTRPCTPVDRVEQVLNPTHPCLTDGNETANGGRFDAKEYTGTDWTGTSWYDTQWAEDEVTMAGTSWYGTSWYGTSWYGTSWYGASWEDGSDSTTNYGDPAEGGAWYGAWQ